MTPVIILVPHAMVRFLQIVAPVTIQFLIDHKQTIIVVFVTMDTIIMVLRVCVVLVITHVTLVMEVLMSIVWTVIPIVIVTTKTAAVYVQMDISIKTLTQIVKSVIIVAAHAHLLQQIVNLVLIILIDLKLEIVVPVLIDTTIMMNQCVQLAIILV